MSEEAKKRTFMSLVNTEVTKSDYKSIISSATEIAISTFDSTGVLIRFKYSFVLIFSETVVIDL